jgi:hypothetical protein
MWPRSPDVPPVRHAAAARAAEALAVRLRAPVLREVAALPAHRPPRVRLEAERPRPVPRRQAHLLVRLPQAAAVQAPEARAADAVVDVALRAIPTSRSVPKKSTWQP